MGKDADCSWNSAGFESPWAAWWDGCWCPVRYTDLQFRTEVRPGDISWWLCRGTEKAEALGGNVTPSFCPRRIPATPEAPRRSGRGQGSLTPETLQFPLRLYQHVCHLSPVPPHPLHPRGSALSPGRAEGQVRRSPFQNTSTICPSLEEKTRRLPWVATTD